MKRDKGSPVKVPIIFKELVENISSLRRGKVNGKSKDKKQLTQCQVLILISKWLESDNESFLKLLSFEYNDKMEWVKNV